MARTSVSTRFCPPELKRTSYDVEQFTVVRKLGSGFASTVYEARDTASNFKIALKAYKKENLTELMKRQLQREIEIQAGLEHKNVLQLFGAFEDDQAIYLMLEFCDRGDLYRECQRRGGLPEPAAVHIMAQLLEVLAYLHSLGIVHRDLKPENILLTSDGLIKLADFGLAIDEEAERPVTRLGTLQFMSPEVLHYPSKEMPHENKHLVGYTEAVDVWATGVLAYEMVVGKGPFARDTQKDMVVAILEATYAFPEGVGSPESRDFVQQCLHKDPKLRPHIIELLQHSWIRKYYKLRISESGLASLYPLARRRSLDSSMAPGGAAAALGAAAAAPSPMADRAKQRRGSLEFPKAAADREKATEQARSQLFAAFRKKTQSTGGNVGAGGAATAPPGSPAPLAPPVGPAAPHGNTFHAYKAKSLQNTMASVASVCSVDDYGPGPIPSQQSPVRTPPPPGTSRSNTPFGAASLGKSLPPISTGAANGNANANANGGGAAGGWRPVPPAGVTASYPHPAAASVDGAVYNSHHVGFRPTASAVGALSSSLYGESTASPHGGGGGGLSHAERARRASRPANLVASEGKDYTPGSPAGGGDAGAAAPLQLKNLGRVGSVTGPTGGDHPSSNPSPLGVGQKTAGTGAAAPSPTPPAASTRHESSIARLLRSLRR